jgi:hypothetical protein
MNALKTGAYSKQFALIGRLLAAEPKTRDALLAIAARAGRKQAKANEVAAFLLTNYARHVETLALDKAAAATGKPRRRPRKNGAEEPVLSEAEGPVLSEVEGPVLSEVEGPVLSEVEGDDRLIPGLPIDDWDSIKEAAARFEQELTKRK